MSASPPFPEFVKPLSDDAGHSYTIPARYYTDPDIYEREKQAIFARTWHYIGHESHVRDSGDGGWKANWKVVVDNYVECYHCANAHPALADLMVMNSYRHEVHEHWARQLSPRVRSDNSAYRVEESDDVQVAAYWYLWPTTSIWLVHGAANLFVLAMMPGNHETTVFSGHRYALDRTPDPARTAYLNETLGPEDQSLCESVQQGLKSQSYNQGRFMVDPARSGTAEHGVHQFHRLVTRALNDRFGR